MISKKEIFKAIVLKTDETKFLSYSQINDSLNSKSFIMQYKDYDSEEIIRFKENIKQSDLIFQLNCYGSKEVNDLVSLGRIVDVEINVMINVKDDFIFDDSIKMIGLSNSDIEMYHVSNGIYSKPCYDYILNLNTIMHVSKDGALGLHCTNKPYEEIVNLSNIKDMSSIQIYDVTINNSAIIKYIEDVEYNKMIESNLDDISIFNKKLIDKGYDVLFIFNRKCEKTVSVTNSVILNLASITFKHSKNPKNTNLELFSGGV